MEFPWAISINFILTQQLPQVQAAAQAAAQDLLKVVPVARSTEPWHTCVGDLDRGAAGWLTTAGQPVGSRPKGDFETGLLRRACARHGKLLLFYFYFFLTWSWKIIPYLLFYFFSTWSWKIIPYFDGLVQDCSNSIANSLELLQSCTKPSKYGISFQIQVEKNVNTE